MKESVWPKRYCLEEVSWVWNRRGSLPSLIPFNSHRLFTTTARVLSQWISLHICIATISRVFKKYVLCHTLCLRTSFLLVFIFWNLEKTVNLSHSHLYHHLEILQFSSVAQLCPTLCDPMDHSTPGLPVHHQVPELTQNHVHWVDDGHPTILSSVIPFSSCPQSLPASGSFQMSQLFTSGGQSIGASASISVLPMNTQDWSPLGWSGWISLQSKGLSRVFSNTTVQKHQFFCAQLSL